jgi:hypothetical protein
MSPGFAWFAARYVTHPRNATCHSPDDRSSPSSTMSYSPSETLSLPRYELVLRGDDFIAREGQVSLASYDLRARE